jgi:uncharacterized protein YcaQ
MPTAVSPRRAAAAQPAKPAKRPAKPAKPSAKAAKPAKPAPLAPALSLSAAEARRIAIAAQGLATHRPARVDRAALARMVARLGVLQIDSVNVLARAHYLPAFSRLGPYDVAELDRMAYTAPRTLFEYWGHMASLLPVDCHPLLRWRMARAADHAWRHVRAMARSRQVIATVLAQVTERGPIGAGDLDVGKRSKAGWWAWSDAKRAVEWLFYTGQVTTAARRGFERLYDLPARVLPAGVLSAATPAEPDAIRELVARSARALGVATVHDLRDYFRLPVALASAAIRELVASGELVAAAVESWDAPAYLHRDAARAAPAIAADRAALVSPFDSLVWARARTERLFGMRYRIEIYTPAHKRVHGYYVLPMLLGDRLVARVDLKADRAARVLRVQAAHLEPCGRADAGDVAAALTGELEAMARWLDLDTVSAFRLR